MTRDDIIKNFNEIKIIKFTTKTLVTVSSEAYKR